MSTAVHRNPNKLWRSSSIFNLCLYRAEVGAFEERLTNARREDDFRSWRAVLKKKVCFYLLSIMLEILVSSLSESIRSEKLDIVKFIQQPIVELL
jgi:hypothetical protein